MPAATLTKSWQVANNGGWAESFNFFIGGAGSPDDITGCTAVLSLIRPGRPTSELLSFSSADDPAYLVITGSPASVALAIPASLTVNWPSGVYDVQLRVFGSASPVDRYNLIGSGRLTLVEAPGT